MYYRETATKSGHKISAKRRSFNCAVLPYMNGKRKISVSLAKKLYTDLNIDANLIIQNL